MINESLSRFLQPVGTLFNSAVRLRNELYDRGWLETKDCGVPVVSVGNLTAGGTGKTPFTALLAQDLREKGKRVAVISRGYRSASEKTVAKVSASSLSKSSSEFGDEPVM